MSCSRVWVVPGFWGITKTHARLSSVWQLVDTAKHTGTLKTKAAYGKEGDSQLGKGPAFSAFSSESPLLEVPVCMALLSTDVLAVHLWCIMTKGNRSTIWNSLPLGQQKDQLSSFPFWLLRLLFCQRTIIAVQHCFIYRIGGTASDSWAGTFWVSLLVRRICDSGR